MFAQKFEKFFNTIFFFQPEKDKNIFQNLLSGDGIVFNGSWDLRIESGSNQFW